MEDNQKYQIIIQTAHNLFWKFGIKRVTIEEICKEAGVSKMTFYKFFPNKIEIAKKVLNNIWREAEARYNKLMAQDIPFAEKVKQQVIMKFEGTKDISEELVKDVFSGWNEELQVFFTEFSTRLTLNVRNDYAEAQKRGEIRQDVNIDFIFYMVQKMTEMVADPAVVAMYGSVQGAIMEFMNMMFYGILERGDE